jgi:hypothetical protein
MVKGAQIFNYIRQQKEQNPDRITKIGDAADQFMGEQVSPRQKRYGAVIEVWRQVLPEELCRHCEIINISGGQLTVRIDSPSYKYELHLCSSEILKELQKQCPSARLTKIKLVNA